MAIFQYQVLDAQGKKYSGSIEASTEKEAKERLRQQGLMLRKLSSNTSTSSKQNLKGESLLTFTMQLSQLINAGIPLYESLLAIEEQYRKAPVHRVILSVCDQVKGGASLSSAMKSHPQSFDKRYCAMVTAGEAVGALHTVLEKLTFLLSRQMKIKKEMTTALIYPSILATFSFFVIILLLGFVVPSIEGLFAERRLNAFTSSVLGVSHFFRGYWYLYLPMFLGVVGYGVFKMRSPPFRRWLEKRLLSTAFLKKVAIAAAMARFCRTMGTLLQGGLNMIDSLRISREVMKNATLEEEIQKAEEKVMEGSSLSHQLKRSPYIPQMMVRMVAVGENSGNIAEMFNKVADLYEEELEKTLARMTALVQPFILIVMGGIIGIVMIAILLPLTDLTSLSLGD